MKTHLTKRNILAARGTLNEKLAEAGVQAEIYLYGGTSMVLAFNARLSTQDVDAVFQPQSILKKLAEKVVEGSPLAVKSRAKCARCFNIIL